MPNNIAGNSRSSITFLGPLIEAGYIYASFNGVIVGSGNGLSHVWHQSIAWTRMMHFRMGSKYGESGARLTKT